MRQITQPSHFGELYPDPYFRDQGVGESAILPFSGSPIPRFPDSQFPGFPAAFQSACRARFPAARGPNFRQGLFVFSVKKILLYPGVYDVPRKPFVSFKTPFRVCCAIYTRFVHCIRPCGKIEMLRPAVKPASGPPCLLNKLRQVFITPCKYRFQKTHPFIMPLKLELTAAQRFFEVTQLPPHFIETYLSIPLERSVGLGHKGRDGNADINEFACILFGYLQCSARHCPYRFHIFIPFGRKPCHKVKLERMPS